MSSEFQEQTSKPIVAFELVKKNKEKIFEIIVGDLKNVPQTILKLCAI